LQLQIQWGDARRNKRHIITIHRSHYKAARFGSHYAMPKFSTIIETIIISILFVGAIVVPFIAIIGKNMMSKSSSSSLPSLPLQQQQQQRSIEIVYFTVGVSSIVGLAFYLYNKNNNNKQNDDKNDKSTTTAVNHKNKSTKSTTTTTTTNQQIKDIWKAGNNNNSQQNSNSNNNNNRTTNTKNRKGAYKEKPFGSKYYYAHNDSNTTGGYKDGLKMEDYRMNGPRLLSRNGLSVQDETTTTTTTTTNDDDDDDDNDKEIPNNNNNNADGNDDDVQDNNTAVAKNITNITKYLWDDPGDSKGIGTIRIDVLPSSSSSSPSFVDVKDVKIENVNASLMDGGRGLLASIIAVTDTGGSCRYYQLKINKLYENASDVKVIIKPKRLLIKIYKKKTKNYNDLVAWPQPHKKI
jgi:hypothetical protein